jgi:hypothetical protein
MDKLELSLWGLSLTAQGTLAIFAAVFIVCLLMAFYHFGKSGDGRRRGLAKVLIDESLYLRGRFAASYSQVEF